MLIKQLVPSFSYRLGFLSGVCVCVCLMQASLFLSSALMNRWSCGVREIDGPQLHLVSSNCKILVTLDSGPWLMELIWKVDSSTDFLSFYLSFSFFLSSFLPYQGPPKCLPERIEWFSLKRTNRLPPAQQGRRKGGKKEKEERNADKQKGKAYGMG